MHVFAGVNVHPVAVGINGEVVQGEVVHAGGEDGEVPAVQDGEVAERDVAAAFERDGLVADAVGERVASVGIVEGAGHEVGLRGKADLAVGSGRRGCAHWERDAAVAPAQAASVNAAETGDGDVFQVFSPDEAVVPVRVAEVLVYWFHAFGSAGS